MILQEIKVRLSKAVILKDAFTGEPVSLSGVFIRTFAGGKTEKRPGGYVLFLDMDSPEFEIEAESPLYQKRRLRLRADQGMELEEILMYPSPAYPIRAGYTAVRGRLEPGSLLRVHLEEQRENSRLMEDYKAGEDQIFIYDRGKNRDTLWYIQKKQEETGEYFWAKQQDLDSERFGLKQPLQSAYPKRDTVICPAKESIADEKGEFYLLLPAISKEQCTLHYSYGKTGCEIHGKTKIVCAGENIILKEG